MTFDDVRSDELSLSSKRPDKEWVLLAQECEMSGVALDRTALEMLVASFDPTHAPMLISAEDAGPWTNRVCAADGWLHEVELREGSDGRAEVFGLVSGGPKPFVYVSMSLSTDNRPVELVGVHAGGSAAS